MTETEDQAAFGRGLRATAPRSSCADWAPIADRPDPVGQVLADDEGRLEHLVPLRHTRMATSAFAFYRGTAGVMAGDLASVPVSGLTVQLCGDAHLHNFGTYASPERRQVFDINDFDETLPGPWEWDVLRLAASAVLAARDAGLPPAAAEEAARTSVLRYARTMAELAAEAPLDVWYAGLTLDQIAGIAESKKDRRIVDSVAAKARRHTSARLAGRLVETVDGGVRFRHLPPLLVPLRAASIDLDTDAIAALVRTNVEQYRASLQPDRRLLLSRYRLVDIALKVVGVGSVGTRCFAVLLADRDHETPLILQIKQSGSSALAAHLPPGEYAHEGERVVQGQRMIQASSDVFLGWSSGPESEFYWRQMHDQKGSFDTAGLGARPLSRYAALCGWTLAHAHARTGSPVAIAAYLGKGRPFAEAAVAFSSTYADLAEADHAAFVGAIAGGRVETVPEE